MSIFLQSDVNGCEYASNRDEVQSIEGLKFSIQSEILAMNILCGGQWLLEISIQQAVFSQRI